MWLQYTIPHFVACFGIVLWGYALSKPDRFCGATDYYYLSIAFATVNLCFLYHTIYEIQIITVASQFVINFFDIINLFVPFLILEVLVIAVFARIFENMSSLQESRLNETTNAAALSERQLFKGYLESIYTTFRLTLNVVDLSRASTDPMRMVMHWFFVLVLPVMIFNYIIGVVSAQVSAMVEVREEKTILHRVGVAMFVVLQEKAFWSVCNKLREKRKKDHLTVRLPASDLFLSRTSGARIENVEEQEDSETLDFVQLQN